MTWLQQFFLSLTFLTRLTAPRRHDPASLSLAQCAWSFPLVGMLVGMASAIIYLICLLLGISPLVAGLLTLLFQFTLTGGLHEDGLADTADALGGQGREQKLAIMKDSRIGSYGVMALVLFIGLKAQSMAGFVQYSYALFGFMGAAALSRAAMAALMHILPAARDDGLAAQAGRPGRVQAVVALAIGVAPLLGLGDMYALVMCLCVATFTLVLAGDYARRVYGGVTGDILGAVQVVMETFLLVTLAACLRS